MKPALKTYRARKESAEKEKQFSVEFAGFAISRNSSSSMRITVPTTIEGVTELVANGRVFCSEGSVRVVTRPAPMIFTDEHFKEVNRLQRDTHYSATAALEEIANKYKFKPESFRRQYYARRGHMLKEAANQ